MVREAKLEDAQQIVEIYNYYILNSISTFEESPVGVNEMAKRMEQNQVLPWLVYGNERGVLGFAYVREWNSRAAYKNTVESTIYLEPSEGGKGIGSTLYLELIERMKAMGIHAIIGGISLPNDGSVALHEKMGFKKVAHFKEVGNKFQKWIDVGYWELLL